MISAPTIKLTWRSLIYRRCVFFTSVREIHYLNQLLRFFTNVQLTRAAQWDQRGFARGAAFRSRDL